MGLSTTPAGLQEPGAEARFAPPADDRHRTDAAAEDVDGVGHCCKLVERSFAVDRELRH
jgi:hypothetical protein